MIENIGRPGFEFISKPDPDVVSWVEAQVGLGQYPRYAEIGIGIGATALEVCRLLDNRGEVHLFDFEDRLAVLQEDLANEGYSNVTAYPNQRLHWDSYVWQLIKLLEDKGEGYFDYVYLDGAHTLFHDLPAYIIAKRLLVEGGLLDFDDYGWSWGGSPTMNPEKKPWVGECMTDEQIHAHQVKMLIDILVDRDSELEAVKPKKLYRKRPVANAA